MAQLWLTVWRMILISRPVFWPSTFLVFLLGVVFSEAPITTSALIFAGLWAFPFSLWVSAVNDLSDIKSDSANPFKGGVSGARVKNSEREFLVNLCFVGAIAVALPSVIFATHLWYLLFATVALVVPYLYSARPVRLKERPPMDSLSNGLFVAAVFLAGYFFHGNIEPSVLTLRVALGIFLAVVGIHVIGALRDYATDRKSRVFTIAVAWGQQGAALFAGFLFLLPLFVVNGLPLEIRLALVFAILCSAFLTLKPGETRSLRLGLGIIIAFCVAVAYSVANESWKVFLLPV